MPHALMLFAAGFGTRMGALTKDRPKPLIEVAGKPLIDHAIDLTAGNGLTLVANSHYHADQIAAHLAPRGVAVNHEPEQILETGGGLRAALPLLGQGPVFTLNTDAVWTGEGVIARMRAAWDPARMEALLLLVPRARARGYAGAGDFIRSDDGRITRGAGDVYTGLQIINPLGINDISEKSFSLNRLWDQMMARGTLFGLLHEGAWCDVGRPESIALAEAMLQGPRDV